MQIFTSPYNSYIITFDRLLLQTESVRVNISWFSGSCNLLAHNLAVWEGSSQINYCPSSLVLYEKLFALNFDK